MITPMTAAMSAVRHHIATSPALPAAARPASDIDVFVATLGTRQDRAMLLAMLLCGLRSAEVRGLRLADRYGSAAAAGDRQRRQGKARAGGAGILHRGVGLSAAGAPTGVGDTAVFCGVLRGPTTCTPVSEAGPRSLFRRHRELSGAMRVRPHRLRHTYGTN